MRYISNMWTIGGVSKYSKRNQFMVTIRLCRSVNKINACDSDAQSNAIGNGFWCNCRTNKN